jgi:hypothetical protein
MDNIATICTVLKKSDLCEACLSPEPELLDFPFLCNLYSVRPQIKVGPLWAHVITSAVEGVVPYWF